MDGGAPDRMRCARPVSRRKPGPGPAAWAGAALLQRGGAWAPAFAGERVERRHTSPAVGGRTRETAGALACLVQAEGLRGSPPARAFIVAGRLIPQEALRAEAAFAARKSMRSRWGGHLVICRSPRGTGGGKQVLAWLRTSARTSLRMPARRPFGRSPTPWPRRRPIPLDRAPRQVRGPNEGACNPFGSFCQDGNARALADRANCIKLHR